MTTYFVSPTSGNLNLTLGVRFRLNQVSGADRQTANALAGRSENGVANRWRSWWNAGLTDTRRGFFARHDMDFYRGHFVDPQDDVVMEVALFGTSAVDS